MAKDKLNLEQLSDSELNEYLRRIEDQRNAVPSEQQLAGGAPRELSLVRVTLHTGRTHQIRVHAAWLGHPLVGDVLYGGQTELGLARQALHAHRLSFEHPVTGVVLDFDRAPPRDFLDALHAAGLQYNAATWWQAVAP